MFLLNVADLLLYYKQLIYNHLQFLQFCENFADFVYWYADARGCYQATRTSYVKV